MNTEFQKIYSEANTLYQNGRTEEAQRLYLRLLETSPNGYADIHNRLGLIFSQKGLTERAAASFEKALEINPKYTEAALNLFVIYNELQRFDDAERVMNRAADSAQSAVVDPYILGRLANEHAQLGDTYYSLGWFDEALAEYQKAITLRPTFADILTKAALALREKGLVEEAVHHLSRAKEANPKYLQAYTYLGMIYYSRGQYDLAAREWESAQKLDPSNKAAAAYANLGRRKTG